MLYCFSIVVSSLFLDKRAVSQSNYNKRAVSRKMNANTEKAFFETVHKVRQNEEFSLKEYSMQKDLRLGLGVIFNNFEFDSSKYKLYCYML